MKGDVVIARVTAVDENDADIVESDTLTDGAVIQDVPEQMAVPIASDLTDGSYLVVEIEPQVVEDGQSPITEYIVHWEVESYPEGYFDVVEEEEEELEEEEFGEEDFLEEDEEIGEEEIADEEEDEQTGGLRRNLQAMRRQLTEVELDVVYELSVDASDLEDYNFVGLEDGIIADFTYNVWVTAVNAYGEGLDSEKVLITYEYSEPEIVIEEDAEEEEVEAEAEAEADVGEEFEAYEDAEAEELGDTEEDEGFEEAEELQADEEVADEEAEETAEEVEEVVEDDVVAEEEDEEVVLNYPYTNECSF